jgi:PAS domain S-box-containing protein
VPPAARVPDRRGRRGQIRLYLTFLAGWAFASTLLVLTVMSRTSEVTALTPTWLFVLGTGALVAALINRDAVSRKEAHQLLTDRQELIDSIGIVTDPRLTQLPLYQLLDELLGRARAVLGADKAGVFLLDKSTGVLELSASHGLEGLSDVNVTVTIGQGLAGGVAASRRADWIADVTDTSGVSPILASGMRSLAAAPMMAEGNLVGVLQIGTQHRRDLRDDDLRLLQLVADRAASAIDASRLEQEAQRATLAADAARRHLALLADAGAVLARPFEEVDALADALSTALVPAFADWYAFNLGARLVATHRSGDLDAGLAGEAGWTRLVREVIESGVPVLLWGPRLREAGLSVADPLGITSIGIVPMTARGTVVGTVALGTAGRRRGYRASDLEAVVDLAARVAVTFERILLEGETRESAARNARQAAQLRRLMEAAFAINAALPETGLADVIAEQAARVLDADGVTVNILGDAARSAAVGTTSRTGNRSVSALTDAAGNRLGDVEASRKNAAFTDEDDSVLASLAQMSSIALANAQLYADIQSSDARLRALYDASPVGIVELDGDGAAVRWNRAAADLFEWPPSEEHAAPMALPEPAIEVVARARLEQTGTADEVILVQGTRRLDLELASVPLRERDGALRGVVLAVVDVTERRQVAEQLEQASRMEAMARLAGGIAHDFNNVLMVITGYTDLLLRRPDVDPTTRRDVEAIRKAATRAADVTRKLLTVSRHQPVAAEVVRIDELLASMHDVIAIMLGGEIELRTLVDEPEPVLVDPSQLEQVVLNLALNAKDAMPDGGLLTFEAWSASESGEQRTILRISDTGEGMDPATVEHCFEPFFTTKDRKKGSGLGLATVYGVVHQAGGEIQVASTRGEGSAFTMRFPAAPVDHDRDAETRGEAPEWRSLRVLVVDDEPELRAIVRDLLELEGHDVVVADSGDAALAAAGEHVPDVLLTDVVMPGMDGIELAQRMIERHPTVKVLYMSAHVDETLHRGAPIDEATFLVKPFSSAQLVEKLRGVLHPQGSNR